MKPDVYRTCTTRECQEFSKEVALTEDEKRYVNPYCFRCHQAGRLRICHNGIEAESIQSFYAIISAMAKEYHVLKKLVVKEVADPDDLKRYEDVFNQIKDLECTACGRSVIEPDHV